jgi:uncharacterized protein (DUF1697 family)
MATFVALLRAVNVGGTGKLPMADLKRICATAGFRDIETYIASGNVVFDSDWPSAGSQAALERELFAYAGKAIGVFMRSAAELRAVLRDNPFAATDPRRTYVHFLHTSPPRDALATARGRNGEEITLGRREIYVHYPFGMGQSKLQIAVAKSGTARNMNTVAKLVGMCTRG